MRELCRRTFFFIALALVPSPALASSSNVLVTIIVFFGVGKHEIAAYYQDPLEDVRLCTEAAANRRVEVTAYTDKSGSTAENKLLSQRRADAAVAALVAAGVPAHRISKAEGLGEDDPLIRDGNPIGTVSRRAEIQVIDDGEATENPVGDGERPRVTERSCDQL